MPPGASDIHLSADGLVIVGKTPHSDKIRGRAFTWTEKHRTRFLPQLPNEYPPNPDAVNADGSIIFGRQGREVVRWTDGGAPEPLGNQKGLVTEPVATTSDGQTFVGISQPVPGSSADSTATIWNATGGFRSLRDVLITDHKLGESLEGWVLRTAADVSGDGSVIIGRGENPPGKTAYWIAILK
jgi:uncharacterized membrane protein